MFESKSGVLLIGGLAFFALAFVSNAVLPVLMYQNLPEESAAELVNANLSKQVEDLADRYGDSFRKYEIGKVVKDAAGKERVEVSEEECAELLRLGRKIYVGEGCWHCHSQFVRPVSNESRRWGPVSQTWEYQNELQRPVMFGTRRVGPDLCREGGRRANDWHAVHFFDPPLLSKGSPMPRYPWFFDGAPNQPNKRGLAIMTYVQWLGSWLPSYPEYEHGPDMSVMEIPPAASAVAGGK